MTDGESQADFTPLKYYSTAFKVARWIRRARMILVRLFFLFIVIVIASFLLNIRSLSYSVSYHSSGGSISLDGIVFLLVFIPLIFFVLRMQLMDMIWRAFAAKNNYKIINQGNFAATAVEKVPSFRAKAISFSSGVITGAYQNLEFAFFTRQYKEGGLLRWRERQMDTVLTIFMPGNLPHIIINARDNERARRSNLSASFPDDHRFNFEGVYGDKYDVHTNPSSRITTLQLFTPDVLTVLYEKLPQADIEIKGNKLWVVQRYGILNDTLARNLFEAGSQLYEELYKQMRSARLIERPTADATSR